MPEPIKSQRFLVVDKNDATHNFEVEAETELDAALKALETLGWDLVAVPVEAAT
jgi:sporulation-control protein spo0M